jgi:hypothetical protein
LLRLFAAALPEHDDDVGRMRLTHLGRHLRHDEGGGHTG